MKQIARIVPVLLLCLAGICLPAGCEKAEEAESAPSPGTDPTAPVGFGTSVQHTETRGEVITNANLASMGVFACYTGADDWTTAATPNYMYNQQVTKKGDAWTYTPLKYWPSKANEKISFFAYAPYMGAGVSGAPIFSSNKDGGYPSFTYTLPQDGTNQQDLLIAAPEMNRTRTTASINFLLKHALTKVVIRLKCTEELTVKNVQVTNVAQSGTVSFDNTADGFHWSGITGTTTCQSNAAVTVPGDAAASTPVATFFLLPQKNTASRLKITYVKKGVTKTTELSFSDAMQWTTGLPLTYTTRIGGEASSAVVGDIVCRDPSDGSLYIMKPDETLTEIHLQRAVAIVYYRGSGPGDSPNDYNGKVPVIHGYAVSLTEPFDGGSSVRWAAVKSDNELKLAGSSTSTTSFNGYYNTNYLRRVSGSTSLMNTYACAAYASDAYETEYAHVPKGTSGWYLPSIAQYVEMYRVWREYLTPSFKKVGKYAKLGVDPPFDRGMYFSSTETGTKEQYGSLGKYYYSIWGLSKLTSVVKRSKESYGFSRPGFTF